MPSVVSDLALICPEVDLLLAQYTGQPALYDASTRWCDVKASLKRSVRATATHIASRRADDDFAALRPRIHDWGYTHRNQMRILLWTGHFWTELDRAARSRHLGWLIPYFRRT